jgi:hypothetical protein
VAANAGIKIIQQLRQRRIIAGAGIGGEAFRQPAALKSDRPALRPIWRGHRHTGEMLEVFPLPCLFHEYICSRT